MSWPPSERGGSDPFQYTSLGPRDLRFLKIHPGAFDEDLSCDVLVLNRDTGLEYTAISYTWGSDYQRTQKIHIRGYEFFIGGNCEYALRQARHFLEEGSLVWIDAICINQSDFKEKGCQVVLMGETYKQAERVLACIGKMETHEDNDLLALLTRQGDSFEKLWASTHGSNECAICLETNFEEPERKLCHVTHHWITTISNQELHSLYDSVEILSASSYWTRLWIVQETIISTDVRILCDTTIIWMPFLHALAMVKQWFTGNEPVLQEVAVQCGLEVSERPGLLDSSLGRDVFQMCLYSTLASTGVEDISRMEVAELECSDPRDRIYGMLQLQKWPESTGPPTPSYLKSRLEVAIDYFNHRGLTLDWTGEVSTILNILAIPDKDCWPEVRSRLYSHPERVLPSDMVDNPSGMRKQCKEHVFPGRFRISGARQCYRVLKGENRSLVTHVRLEVHGRGEEVVTNHSCPRMKRSETCRLS